MKMNPLPIAGFGLAGLLAAGVLVLPATAGAKAPEPFAKRNDDLREVTLVVEDDTDDLDDDRLQRDTRSRDDNTRTGRSRSNSRTGSRSGRDNSINRGGKDWTRDGKGPKVRDWSRNQTNDRSRHNTR